MMMVASIAYLLLNMAYTLSVEPVYPPITWRGTKGIAISISPAFLGVLAYFVMEKITNFKIRRQGNCDLVDFLENKNKVTRQ